MENIESISKLSPVQEGMLFHSIYEPNKNYYIVQKSLDFEGSLNVNALKESIILVHEKYGLLRSTFEWEGLSESLIITHKKTNINWKEYFFNKDLKKQSEVEEFMKKDFSEIFDLSKEPPLRWSLLLLNENKYKLVFTHHHIILDGWSLDLLFKEIMMNYNKIKNGLKVEVIKEVPFVNYVDWLNQKNMIEDELFWKKHLKGISSPTPINFFYNQDNNNKSINNDLRAMKNNIKENSHVVKKELVQSIENISKKLHVSVNSLLLGAWGLLLHTYSDSDDIIFGSTFSGRTEELEDLENRVGMFINTVPIRSYLNKKQNTQEYLKTIQNLSNSIQKHQNFPPVSIKKASEFKQKDSLFDSIFVYEKYPNSTDEKWEGLTVIRDQMKESSHYPISVIVTPDVKGYWNLKIKYEEFHLSEHNSQRVLQHFETILISLINNMDNNIEECSCINEQELLYILNDLSRGVENNIEIRDFYSNFEDIASRTPDSYSVMDENQKYTYQDLLMNANTIAIALKEKGLKSGDIIGIYMDREVNLISCILAVWKLGASFVPLDTDLVKERIQYIIEDAKIKNIILGSKNLIDNISDVDINYHLVEDLAVLKNNKMLANQKISTGSTAYIIYTSGSTGKPKGVIVSHENISNYINFAASNYIDEKGEGAILHTSISFDLTLTSLLVPLVQGKTVFISSSKELNNLNQKIGSTNVNFTKLTPSHMKMLEYESNLKDISKRCNKWILGGEALTYETIRPWQKASLNNLFINEYGPTEATIGCTTFIANHEVKEGTVPVGRPIDNTQVYVLNRFVQPVPVGVLGEIYIGGKGVAKGYLNKPELTNERFLDDPFSYNGNKLYKTGDIGYYLEDGNLVYVKRNDDQLKVRGHRIEPVEIEKVLIKCDGISEAKVLSASDNHGNEMLIAYIVTEKKVKNRNLRSVLRNYLPEYLIPDKFIQLESFPLTINLKVDKERLPNPKKWINEENRLVEPASKIEKDVLGIWVNVLDMENISVVDDFFEIGGHSLLAIKITSLLKDKFNISLKVSDIFKYPSVSEISKYIESISEIKPKDEKQIIPQIRRQRIKR